MTGRTLETFAGWLLFEGERVAEISHLPPGKRMLFEQTVAAITWPETVDFEKATAHRVIVNRKGRIMGAYPDDDDHMPALPRGWKMVEVWTVEDVHEALEKADVSYEP